MDTAVGLVEAYLRVNGYFTVTEYPVVETRRYGDYRTATDLDVLAFRFPGAGRLAPFQTGKTVGEAGIPAFAPDPHLGGVSDQADMLIGEVKEGRAELNSAARDPVVLRAVLSRFGCCSPEHVPGVVQALLRHGRTLTHCGHLVRLVAFGSLPPAANGGKYAVISLGHVHEFLEAYVREHWDVLCHAQFKDPAFGFEVLLEKMRRGSHASLA
jgi:hypothetical protein